MTQPPGSLPQVPHPNVQGTAAKQPTWPMCACQGQPSGRGWGRRSSHLPDGRLQHGVSMHMDQSLLGVRPAEQACLACLLQICLLLVCPMQSLPCTSLPATSVCRLQARRTCMFTPWQ